jgi:hypothetical protein
MAYRIIWFISPPYVARAAEMASSKGGLIANRGGLIPDLVGYPHLVSQHYPPIRRVSSATIQQVTHFSGIITHIY